MQSKSISLVQGHFTKAEIESRKQSEAALTTAQNLQKSKAVKDNKIANRYFNRLITVLKDVQLNDGLFENVLNRYCLLLAEHEAARIDRERIERNLERLEEREPDMEFADYLLQSKNLTDQLLSVDRILSKKRDQLLQIERENLLTIQGKLRAIPKKPEKKEASGIAAYKAKREG